MELTGSNSEWRGSALFQDVFSLATAVEAGGAKGELHLAVGGLDARATPRRAHHWITKGHLERGRPRICPPWFPRAEHIKSLESPSSIGLLAVDVSFFCAS